jgi:hypothetical protein
VSAERQLKLVSALPEGWRENANNRALQAYVERANRAINLARSLNEASHKITTRALSTTPEAMRDGLRTEIRRTLWQVLDELNLD